MDWVDEFRTRLMDTARWGAARASTSDVEHCLRTPDLRPACVTPLGEWLWYAHKMDNLALADARVRLLQEASPVDDRTTEGASGGKILVYFPDATLSDGTQGAASEHYFDQDNVPPWDTWLWYDYDPTKRVTFDSHVTESAGWNRHLYCWVPEALVSYADAGVTASWEATVDRCLLWASDFDSVVTRRFREEGMLF